MSVPNSTIYVMSEIPLNNSYEHTLYFKDRAEQYEYFHPKAKKSFEKYTYLRENQSIKVIGEMDNAMTWNYLMLHNNTGKWFYYFINKVEYLSDSTVVLHIEMDVIQTYMFDWDLKPCFVERTHTPTDEFGEHTIPEGLETGPLVCTSTTEINLEDNCILILSACNASGGNSYSRMYGGVFSGLSAYAVNPSRVSDLESWLNMASEQGFIDAIVAMWMYPKDLVYISGEWGDNTLMHQVEGVYSSPNHTITDPYGDMVTLNGAGIRNKKTFCYPYTMMYVSNNMGGHAVFHRERFKKGEDYNFVIQGALSPDSGVQLVPYNYKGKSGKCFEESLSLGAFPTCAWDSDTYKVWLAQNQHTMDHNISQAKIQAVMGAGTALGSLATGNLGGGAAGLGVMYNAYNQTQALMAQKADMEVQPPQARGNHSGNINLTHGRMGFTVYFMNITAEYAKCIDDYFTRYGYKVNRVMVPSLYNRDCFTYVKTVGCWVTGPFGSEDQIKIQNIFDKGITFWAEHYSVGNYNISNDPL